MSGRLDAALPLLEQAAAEGQAIKLVYGHPESLIYAGEAHLAAGGLDEARRYAAQALELATRQGARGDEARALFLLGEIAGRGGPSEGEKALENYVAALVLAKELGMAPLQARCHLGLGGVYRRVGRDEEARGELTYAVAMLQAMQMQHWLPR
jgi:tetratricopeptide (TPR) repeat protein